MLKLFVIVSFMLDWVDKDIPLPATPPQNSRGDFFSEQLDLDLGLEPDGLTLEDCEGDNWLCDLFLKQIS